MLFSFYSPFLQETWEEEEAQRTLPSSTLSFHLHTSRLPLQQQGRGQQSVSKVED